MSGGARSARLTARFTALNGPLSAGLSFAMLDAPPDVAEEVPDVSVDPVVVSILPTNGMTGVHLKTIDVELVFSEAVTFADVLGVSNTSGVPEVFELQVWNTTTDAWQKSKALQLAAGALATRALILTLGD